MSWFQSSLTHADVRTQASVAEVVDCFHNQKHLLSRLALLITGDEVTAEQSVVNACENTIHGHSPFRDWLLEWAKAATLTSAILPAAEAIRRCESAYHGGRCTHPEHLSQGEPGERKMYLDLLLQADPSVVLTELDALCRAVLVLRVAIRSSIQDCVVRLNVPRAAVLAANCRAMTWLHDLPLSHMGNVTYQ